MLALDETEIDEVVEDHKEARRGEPVMEIQRRRLPAGTHLPLDTDNGVPAATVAAIEPSPRHPDAHRDALQLMQLLHLDQMEGSA
ncbi:hypothetical protein [Parafrankia irregularis]|uniref:hypothetical protein n=1 Tax=Parafrankia irregularis TaxID=795642 RepID=UPI000B874D3D|nr:hypothetical protein [Parafrankia irregularis]MBE3205732.1 hypothetical protein [Parafrankia sp. CH37]